MFVLVGNKIDKLKDAGASRFAIAYWGSLLQSPRFICGVF